ncbi:MAG: hypothetical protein WCP63_03260 [Cyanobium sp. ELA712]
MECPRAGRIPARRPGSGSRETLALASGASLLLALVGAAPLRAAPGPMGSPWWENYDVRQSFICPGRGTVVLERNDSQASLLSGGFRSTLFREPASGGEISFRNDDFRVTLQGDVLTLEQATRQITCLRTEEV